MHHDILLGVPAGARFKRSVAKENRLALCHNDRPDRQQKRVRPGPRPVSEILEVA
jgi:hypothetical protein